MLSNWRVVSLDLVAVLRKTEAVGFCLRELVFRCQESAALKASLWKGKIRGFRN